LGKLSLISDFLQDIAGYYNGLAVAGRRIVYFSGFFVMAGLDPVIHENAESCNQGNDNVP
jgi:hypothetical protein